MNKYTIGKVSLSAAQWRLFRNRRIYGAEVTAVQTFGHLFLV